ncbi:MAG TPA: G1 family glutamic endopeptidase [Gaiellaceae bacterium]|nr:G1 family glutamic endopeptidase [Gaiellaceae bacterium]
MDISSDSGSTTKMRLLVTAFAFAAVGLSVLLARPAGAASVVNGRASLTAQADVSQNWAGYVATGPGSTSTTASPNMNYTDVTGQWVQPKAVCTPGSPTSVAIWVGLGGYSETSQELEQTGTSADCNEKGKASYYLWYELVPANSVNIDSLKIRPGDVIASVVKVNGTDVLVQVIDRSRKTRFTRHLTMATPDLTSAEWIVEAPSECRESGFCSQLALTNFGSVNFTRSFAIGNNVPAAISGSGWVTTALQLVPRGHRFFGGENETSTSAGYGSAGAVPTALSTDGAGFGITWQANPALPVG